MATISYHILSPSSQARDCVRAIVSYTANVHVVNVILVLGSERLHSDMIRRFDGRPSGEGETITVVKLDKSGGCADRDDTYLQQTRQASIREYFFGDSKRTLSPHTQQVDFGALTIYKIRECKSIVVWT